MALIPGYRIGRAAEDIKRELSDIMRSLKDPRVAGLLSIVRVEVSGDLSYAKVYISSMEGLEQAKTAVKGLQNGSGYIRKELGRRVRLRKVPELKFIADDSIAHSAEILRMLESFENGENSHED